MALPRFAVSIVKKYGGTQHVLELYHAENEVIAAYVVFANNFEFEWPDNDERAEYDLEEAMSEFEDYGYNLQVVEIHR